LFANSVVGPGGEISSYRYPLFIYIKGLYPDNSQLGRHSDLLLSQFEVFLVFVAPEPSPSPSATTGGNAAFAFQHLSVHHSQ